MRAARVLQTGVESNGVGRRTGPVQLGRERATPRRARRREREVIAGKRVAGGGGIVNGRPRGAAGAVGQYSPSGGFPSRMNFTATAAVRRARFSGRTGTR